MPDPAIEEFANLIVRRVRDEAINNCDRILTTNAKSPIAKRWAEAAGDDGAKAISATIPDIVDQAIFALLDAIDHGQISLQFVASNGTRVDLTEEGLGELAGWYMGSGGWRASFSKERHVDDFGDLA